MKTLESSLQKQVEEYLKANHIMYRRTQGGYRSGYPDIEIFYRGHYIGVELKRPDGKGKATQQQLKVLSDLRANGFIAELVESVNEVKMIIWKVQKSALNTNSHDIVLM